MAQNGIQGQGENIFRLLNNARVQVGMLLRLISVKTSFRAFSVDRPLALFFF
jgi:hypothetical protein